MTLSVKYLAAETCMTVLAPLTNAPVRIIGMSHIRKPGAAVIRGLSVVGIFWFLLMIPGVALAGVGQKPDPATAVKLSLSEAKDIIQHGYRYSGSDGASDHP